MKYDVWIRLKWKQWGIDSKTNAAAILDSIQKYVLNVFLQTGANDSSEIVGQRMGMNPLILLCLLFAYLSRAGAEGGKTSEAHSTLPPETQKYLKQDRLRIMKPRVLCSLLFSSVNLLQRDSVSVAIKGYFIKGNAINLGKFCQERLDSYRGSEPLDTK